MPEFGKTSFERIKTCNISIVKLFFEVVKEFDCTVIQGDRGAVEQMNYYHNGKSKLVYPLGKHNPVYEGEDLKKLADIIGCDVNAIPETMPFLEHDLLLEIDANAPYSKSRAVDVIPYPVDWAFEQHVWCAFKAQNKAGGMIALHNIERWAMFIGVVKGIASQMKIPIICGADWDGDNQMSDQKFDDWPHFELKEDF